MANDTEPSHDILVLYAKDTISFPLISYRKMQPGDCIFKLFLLSTDSLKKNLCTICPRSGNLSFHLHNFVQNLPPNVIDECCSGKCGGRYLLINKIEGFIHWYNNKKSTLPIHQIIEVSHSEACVNRVSTN